jgi:cellulose synthase/poly-beta-1,6-N-acetylglucosamine synthase-like glycosyltransferase
MQLFETVILWMVYGISLYFSIFLVLVFADTRKSFFKEKSSTYLNSYPIVSILVPAYNEESTIGATMKSIYEINYPKSRLDVILINDGSSDATLSKMQEFISSHDAKHFRILSHQNMGKAGSLNTAIELASGKYFACLDADSFVDKLSLRKMLAMFEKENDGQLAIITPAMKVDSPKGILQKIQWFEYLVMIFVGRLTSHLDSLYVAPGPFSLYRLDVIKELGGFAKDTLTEDQEIAYRMQKGQYRIKQCFDAYVYTVAPNKLPGFYRQRRRWYMGSMQCAYKYKDMIANKKYGDFGVLQMVKNVLGYGLALCGIAFAIYFFALPMLEKIVRGISISFDIWPYVRSFELTISPLLFNMQQIMILGILFAVSAFFFVQAHSNANEKIHSRYYLSIIPYFAFYYLLKGGILLLSMMEFARVKKIKW